MYAFAYNEFHCSYILIVSLFGSLIFVTQSSDTNGHSFYNGGYSYCNTTSNRTNPEFHANLDSLLSSLASNAAAHNEDGFYKEVRGQGTPDIVNGQYICFGYVNASVCEGCVKAAAKNIRGCINQTEAVLWYDACMLLYQNRSYAFDDMYNDPSTLYIWNAGNISSSEMERERFNESVGNLLNGLVKKAANRKSKKFATGELNFPNSQTIYSLVQCVPDLDPPTCKTCLMNAISNLSSCCAGKAGARIVSTACNIRYEVYPFYSKTANSTTPGVFPPTPPFAASDRPPSGNFLFIVETIMFGLKIINR